MGFGPPNALASKEELSTGGMMGGGFVGVGTFVKVGTGVGEEVFTGVGVGDL